jgi:50S ribosomal subunit-associated GTPase HflX
VRLPGNLEVLLSDTVGFIQKLPTQLVAAFRATLEEIREASLIVHVLDASADNAAAQCNAVLQVGQGRWGGKGAVGFAGGEKQRLCSSQAGGAVV